MAKKSRRPEDALLEELRERLTNLRSLLPSLSFSAAKRATAELLALTTDIESARAVLDPVKDPGSSFDPADPDTIGRLVALALVAQDRVGLNRIARTYGSGIYAIYYLGDHPAYAPLSRSETPIYVGKADPARPNARTPREQGAKLYGRLDEHRRVIQESGEYAVENELPHPLRVEDFECRRLICATNAQLAAEQHLINIFKPIWNSEIRICWGISKHGDSAETRSNKRSPWHVIHPGRSWALAEILEDKMSPEVIVARIAGHMAANPPYRGRVHIVREILSSFAQNAAMSPEESSTGDAGEAAVTG